MTISTEDFRRAAQRFADAQPTADKAAQALRAFGAAANKLPVPSMPKLPMTGRLRAALAGIALLLTGCATGSGCECDEFLDGAPSDWRERERRER